MMNVAAAAVSPPGAERTHRQQKQIENKIHWRGPALLSMPVVSGKIDVRKLFAMASIRRSFFSWLWQSNEKSPKDMQPTPPSSSSPEQHYLGNRRRERGRGEGREANNCYGIFPDFLRFYFHFFYFPFFRFVLHLPPPQPQVGGKVMHCILVFHRKSVFYKLFPVIKD